MAITKHAFLKFITITPNMGVSSGFYHDGTTPLPVDSTTTITRGYPYRIEDITTLGIYVNGQLVQEKEGTVLSTDSKFYYTLSVTWTTVTTTNFIIGHSYQIKAVGNTDFTLIGASSNTVGVAFVATGIGTGTTGTAYELNPTLVDNIVITIKPNSAYQGIGYISGTSTSAFYTSDIFVATFYYNIYTV